MTEKKANPENPQEEMSEMVDGEDVTEIRTPDEGDITGVSESAQKKGSPKTAALEEGSAKQLLENITTPLVVELGRVNLSIMAVGGLKAGSIIELSRTPSDAVDLVVAGKSIGKGELVEVEGELGVRIISLVK